MTYRWTLVPSPVRTAKADQECAFCGRAIKKGQKYAGSPTYKVHVRHTKDLTFAAEQRLNLTHLHRWVDDPFGGSADDQLRYECVCGATMHHDLQGGTIEIFEHGA